MEVITSLREMLGLDAAVLDTLREHGHLDLATLTRRVDRQVAGPVDSALVSEVAHRHPVVVRRPDGSFAHLAHVLDGIVLTHRVRGALRGATDLWVGGGLLPLELLAFHMPLPLADGREVTGAATIDPVLVGPPGWLPDAERGDLLALRWSNGELSASLLDPIDLAPPAEEGHVRELLAERLDAERWWSDDDAVERTRLLTRALGLARLEDPELLSTPHAPLDELLFEPLAERSREVWRDFAATRQCEQTTLTLDQVPVRLERELERRATRYGMSRDQFIVALLGHLAWRTPFAEDMEPWDQWLPERSARDTGTAPVVALRPVPHEHAGPPPAAG